MAGEKQVDYAKTSRSSCKGCKNSIKQGDIRIGVSIPSSFFDGQVKYKTLSTDTLEGFRLLKLKDKNRIREAAGEPLEEESNLTIQQLLDKKIAKALTRAEQNDLDWKVQDYVQNVPAFEIKEQLILNNQATSGGDAAIVRRFSHGMVYGSVPKCPKCKEGNLHYDDVGDIWKCTNYSNEWSQCTFEQSKFNTVEHTPFVIDFTRCKPLIDLALMSGLPKPREKSTFLNGLKVFISGRVGRTKDQIKTFLSTHSGILQTEITDETSVVITSENTLYKENQHVNRANELGVPIAKEEYLDHCVASKIILPVEEFLLDSRPAVAKAAIVPAGDDSSVPSGGMVAGRLARPSTLRQRKQPIRLVKDMPSVPKKLLMADASKSLGVALCKSYFDPKGVDPSAKIDTSRFNIDFLDLNTEQLFLHNCAKGFIGFDPIVTAENLLLLKNEEQEAEENLLAKIEQDAAENEVKRPRALVPGKKYSLISKKYVDQKEEFQNYHLYEEGNTIFNVTLSQLDLVKKINSYYKMQLLEHDTTNNKYSIWFSWGRLGTTIGSTKTEPFSNLSRALKEFENKFYQKTHNRWADYVAGAFAKYGGSYFPLDIEYEEDEDLSEASEIPSVLHPRVQELVKLIFDTDTMNKAMLGMNLDTQKMPLGKLSQSMIKAGYSILLRIENVLKDVEVKDNLITLTNQFYTVIPHSFGRDNPPIINNFEILKQKMEMLETLIDIEIASSILKSSDNIIDNKKLNPIDKKYFKLNAAIEYLDKSSPIWSTIAKSIESTHSEIHRHFKLEIVDIFEIKRKGEHERFARFDCVPNHKLLWHGSRLSNFVGIISQGLRIAPPEAPHSGYMFGKGIYHADMASKSAEYCHPPLFDNNLLLVLSEVALGQWNDEPFAKFITKDDVDSLGKHSIRGLGRYYPAPAGEKILDPRSSAVIQSGKEISTGVQECDLDHQEFIVYDPSQVKQKYIVYLKSIPKK